MCGHGQTETKHVRAKTLLDHVTTHTDRPFDLIMLDGRERDGFPQEGTVIVIDAFHHQVRGDHLDLYTLTDLFETPENVE